MPRLDREQVFPSTVLVLLLLVSASVVGVLFQTRADAVQEVPNVVRCSRASKPSCEQTASRPTAAAPPTAFLDASTPGLASAQLQSYLAQLAGDQRASLVSSGEKLPSATTHLIRSGFRLRLDMNLQALCAVLYQLESGTPYVFVDALAVQPIGATAGSAVEDRCCGPL